MVHSIKKQMKDFLKNAKEDLPEVQTISSRSIALQVLDRWQNDLSPVGPVMDYLSIDLSDTDRNLVGNMVYGVLSNMEYLDVILGRFSRHPLKKMKSWSLMALRLGIYQLLFLDRVPESAAVNETVKAFKSRRQPKWLVNFINGVLREIGRKKNSLPKPEVAGQGGGPVLNHPEWLLQRWEKRFGLEKAVLICKVNNQKPPLTLRVNTSLVTCDELKKMIVQMGVSVRCGRYAENSLLLDTFSGTVTNLVGYNEGYFQVQDEAAQLAVSLLGQLQKGGRYLDACAGLGGKTGLIALQLPEKALLHAVEPEQNRFRLLGENLHRLHLFEKVKAFQGSLEQFAQGINMKFSGILVDAPCTGTGVIRRHPDMRWSRDSSDFLKKQKIQLELLETAVSLLSSGGVLVYATCSLETEENEQVVNLFLKKHQDFKVSGAQDYLHGSAASLIDENGFFCSTPADGLDGFFAVRLVAPL